MRINVDHSEFLDFIATMFFNLLKDPTFMSDNERFNELREVMINKGMLAQFFKYYLGSSSETRKEYKRFKNVLQDDSRKPGTIFIYPDIKDVIKEMQEILGQQLNEDEIIKQMEKE
jgi:hypothetical protein